MKLVTDAAAFSSPTGDGRTAAFGQKENTGKVNTGGRHSVLTNSVSLAHTDNGLGHLTLPKLSTFKPLNRNRSLMFFSGSMTIGSSYQTNGADVALPAHMRMLSDRESV